MDADVYARLREDVTSGDLAPGEQLVELTLAARYGTSRTPVREALRRLEQDGLVEQHGRGIRVRSRSPEEILEVYEVRITLEGLAARAAAEHRTEMDLVRVRAAQQRAKGADAGDPRALVVANRDFHTALWEASRNATLVDLLHRLQVHLLRYKETTLGFPGRWDAAMTEHDEIVSAVVERDAARAGEVAERHMRHAREVRLTMYVEQQYS